MQPPHFDSDVLIVGAGPAGLALALALGQAGLTAIVLDSQSHDALSTPAEDGREIALTHASVSTLEALGVWKGLVPGEVGLIREARVLDGAHHDTALCFDARASGHEALGWIVPNHALRRASYEAALASSGNVRVLAGARVLRVDTHHDHASIAFERTPSGTPQRLCAPLLVAADSRFSTTRRQLGIGADMHDFGRTMIVCRMQHAQPHKEIAHECFGYERTLAVLPLHGDFSSIVLTSDAASVAHLMRTSAEDFAALVRRQFRDRLGGMALQGERHAYPLVAVYAHRFVGQRSALVGDAAVGMHPVTAHGYNLGLQGAATLARMLGGARRTFRDIGDAEVLARYDQAHRRHTSLIYHGTNAVARLYADTRPPQRLLRQLVLRGAQHLPPVKAAITRQLTGRGGRSSARAVA